MGFIGRSKGASMSHPAICIIDFGRRNRFTECWAVVFGNHQIPSGKSALSSLPIELSRRPESYPAFSSGEPSHCPAACSIRSSKPVRFFTRPSDRDSLDLGEFWQVELFLANVLANVPTRTLLTSPSERVQLLLVMEPLQKRCPAPMTFSVPQPDYLAHGPLSGVHTRIHRTNWGVGTLP